jgi:hypothetical protein
MKKLIILAILLIPNLIVNAQGIGELAPEKKPEVFPNNALGLDVMFSEGGIGFGGFYRRQLTNNLTAFIDFSISESKDDREFEYIDYFGQTFTIGKKNRVFLIPFNFGLHYRLFESVLHDNLRPYINAGAGPAIAVTTPYEREFFNAFGYAQAKYTAGGYIGLGANFGLDKSSLVGINFRYYLVHFFDEGVESLHGRYRKNIGGFYLTLNFGVMY